MPRIPDEWDVEIPHQDRRPNKPVVPKQKAAQTDTIPKLLPTIRMRSTVSLHDEPDDEVTKL